MKIWYQSNSVYRYDPAAEGYGKNLEAMCKRAGRPGTEFFVTGVPVHGDHIDRYKSIMYYHAQQSINNMMKAEKEGYDAFIIGCSYDVGMEVGRELVSIPVVAIAQANLFLAAMMGELFTVVTCEPWLAERYRQLVRQYGIQPKYMGKNYVVPISEYELAKALKPVEAGNKAARAKEISKLAGQFKETAKQAVADGASVIIPVPAHISQLFFEQGGLTNLDGATVFDPVAVAVKTAEMWADLKKLGIEVSRTYQVYAAPEKDLLKKNLKMYSECFRIDC